MNIESFAKTKIGKFIVRGIGSAMESSLRYRFFGPMKILENAEIQPGQIILEIGCGTGYFTLPAARLIGENGNLIAMDILPESVDLVSRKVRDAALKNVRVIKGDALNTGLDDESFDIVLLFGEIPAPILPLEKLLPEMHRVLKKGGKMAVWPPVPGWLPHSILKTGLFSLSSRRKGVYNFDRC